MPAGENSVSFRMPPQPTNAPPSGSSSRLPSNGELSFFGWTNVFSDLRGLLRRVDLQHERARVRLLLRDRAVVEERDRRRAVEARVVLVAELHRRGRPEVAALPAETPDDRAVAADQIERARVAARDEDRPAGPVGDRVDVEVVERPLLRRVVRRLAVRLDRLGERDVVEAVPLEDDLPCLDVDLLDDAVLCVAVLRPADRAQVDGNLVVDGDVRGAARRQLELVQVAVEAVRRPSRSRSACTTRRRRRSSRARSRPSRSSPATR